METQIFFWMNNLKWNGEFGHEVTEKDPWFIHKDQLLLGMIQTDCLKVTWSPNIRGSKHIREVHPSKLLAESSQLEILTFKSYSYPDSSIR